MNRSSVSTHSMRASVHPLSGSVCAENTHFRWIIVSTGALFMVLGGSTGCYTRVVRAEGIGSSRIQTEESYVEDWPIEPIGKALDPEPQAPQRRRSTRYYAP